VLDEVDAAAESLLCDHALTDITVITAPAISLNVLITFIAFSCWTTKNSHSDHGHASTAQPARVAAGIIFLSQGCVLSTIAPSTRHRDNVLNAP
jgi:hypothetical protein